MAARFRMGTGVSCLRSLDSLQHTADFEWSRLVCMSVSRHTQSHRDTRDAARISVLGNEVSCSGRIPRFWNSLFYKFLLIGGSNT